MLDVFRHVEFTPDVYERVRLLLDESGIVLDESLDAIVPDDARRPDPVAEPIVPVAAEPSPIARPRAGRGRRGPIDVEAELQTVDHRGGR